MSPLLQEALSLALQLNPKERLQLVEQVVASVENELEIESSPISRPKTGAEIVAMLEKIEPIELDHPEIQDPVEWVKTIRQEQAMKRNLDWDNEV